MTSLASKIARHQAAFSEPLALAKKRADWLRDRLVRGTGKSLVLDAIAYDRAAEEHQMAAHREAVARKHWGIPDE